MHNAHDLQFARPDSRFVPRMSLPFCRVSYSSIIFWSVLTALYSHYLSLNSAIVRLLVIDFGLSAMCSLCDAILIKLCNYTQCIVDQCTYCPCLLQKTAPTSSTPFFVSCQLILFLSLNSYFVWFDTFLQYNFVQLFILELYEVPFVKYIF